MRLALLAAALFALPALAQVEVMEPGGGRPAPAFQGAPRSTPADTPLPQGSSGGDLYNQVLLLQDEVMKLRGLVEEQAEQLRQLKQQRLDDYISLDRRIGSLGGGSVAPAADAAGGGTAPAMPPGGLLPGEQPAGMPPQGAPPVRADLPPSAPATPATPIAGEEPAYQAAYELVRGRRFPEAVSAFNNFLAQYPQGMYSGNAHYWLGELYLLDGDSDSAKKHFEALVYQFPDNRKLPDGMFKLGRIYHQEGDAARARELLQRVVNEYQGSDSPAPRLAREYLQQNF